MLAELVLATRLLGLVNHEQPLDVQVDANVRAVEIAIDGKTIARLTARPFKTVLDFGPELAPHELTAIAYDEAGNEVGRDRQLVNLARPQAEAEIDLEPDPASGRLRATVRWQHISAQKPKRVELRLDGKPLAKSAKAILPALDGEAIHVLQAKVQFSKEVIATKELVFGGHYSTEMPAELTSVVASADAQCFRSGDRTLRAAAIEDTEAMVLMVRGIDPSLAWKRLRLPAASNKETAWAMHRPFRVENAMLRVIWPVSREMRDERQVPVNLFYRSYAVAGRWGTHRLLTLAEGPKGASQRFADAAAVAGVQALSGGKRRVVVLVLGGERDDSRHSPGVVRRYLARIGVPLRVWSLTGVTDEMKEAWGDVKDISNPDRLRIATEELRAELESQRIAWLPLQPMEALQAKPVSCAP